MRDLKCRVAHDLLWPLMLRCFSGQSLQGQACPDPTALSGTFSALPESLDPSLWVFSFCPAPLDCHSKWQNQPLNSKTQLIIVSTAESFLNTRWGQKLYWPSKKVRGWWTLTSPGQCGSFSNTGQIRRVLIFSSWDWQHPHRAKPAKGLERPCSLTISSPIVSQIGKLDNKCPGNEGLLLRLFRYGEED